MSTSAKVDISKYPKHVFHFATILGPIRFISFAFDDEVRVRPGSAKLENGKLPFVDEPKKSVQIRDDMMIYTFFIVSIPNPSKPRSVCFV